MFSFNNDGTNLLSINIIIIFVLIKKIITNIKNHFNSFIILPIIKIQLDVMVVSFIK